jgi:hypothetical protein
MCKKVHRSCNVGSCRIAMLEAWALAGASQEGVRADEIWVRSLARAGRVLDWTAPEGDADHQDGMTDASSSTPREPEFFDSPWHR